MNCRNAFQINQYLENRMTNRVSLLALLKEIFTESVKLLVCILVLIFPLRRLDVQAFWRHGITQHCNVCLLNVSFQDMSQRIRSNGRHTLWHCKGHTGGILSLVFPYGHSSYLTVRIDKWRATFLHMRVSYLRNQNG